MFVILNVFPQSTHLPLALYPVPVENGLTVVRSVTRKKARSGRRVRLANLEVTKRLARVLKFHAGLHCSRNVDLHVWNSTVN
jgi:hypothetical protein